MADRAEKRIQTGLEVADASDDAAIFAISQQSRADVRSWEQVMRAQGPATTVVTAASAGVKAISDLVDRLKATVVAYAGVPGPNEQAIPGFLQGARRG